MSAMKRVFEIVDYPYYSVLYEDGCLAVADTVGGTWECVRDEDQDDVNEFLNNNKEGK
jgi:hypothetical protein